MLYLWGSTLLRFPISKGIDSCNFLYLLAFSWGHLLCMKSMTLRNNAHSNSYKGYFKIIEGFAYSGFGLIDTNTHPTKKKEQIKSINIAAQTNIKNSKAYGLPLCRLKIRDPSHPFGPFQIRELQQGLEETSIPLSFVEVSLSCDHSSQPSLFLYFHSTHYIDQKNHAFYRLILIEHMQQPHQQQQYRWQVAKFSCAVIILAVSQPAHKHMDRHWARVEDEYHVRLKEIWPTRIISKHKIFDLQYIYLNTC